MKKLLLILLLLCMVFCFCSCAGPSGGDGGPTKTSSGQLSEPQAGLQPENDSRVKEYSKMISQALEVLRAGWKEEYDRYGKPGLTFRLDIRGVRVVKIRDGLDENTAGYLQNAKYIVEFLFYDDYFGSPAGYAGHNAGYYSCSFQKNNVIVDRNGKMSLGTMVIDRYRTRTYETDFSKVIEEVTDCNGQYNQVIEFSY